MRLTDEGLLELVEDTDGPGLYIAVDPTEFKATLEALLEQRRK